MALKFKLVTPDRSLFDEEAASVTLPTSEGEVTILPHHAPFTALVTAGIAHLTKADGKMDEVAVSDGFVHVTQSGEVTVLTDTAERGFELDVSTIEQAKERAKELMKKTAAMDDVSFAAAAAALEKELARLRLAHKHQPHARPVAGSTEQRE